MIGALMISMVVWLSVMHMPLYCFNTLEDMQKYVHTVEEYPKSDNENWFHPDYTTFYREQRDSLKDRILTALGLRHSLWQASQFKQCLQEVTEQQESLGYSGRYVMHITPQPGDRFVIFGNIEGAYHSLVRDLKELEQKNIITNDLKIIQPDCYLIFNGNVLNRSPYILETLTIVLMLMKKNPDRVIYIRGAGEDRERWYDLGTKDALEEKASLVSKEKIPLNTELKKFLNTLPLALYLIAEKTEQLIKVVRISNFPNVDQEIDEQMLGNFFMLPDTARPATYTLFDRIPTSPKVTVVATIKDEDRSLRYTQTRGLVRLGFDGIGIVWSVLSSPTSSYQNLYNFFWDAYAILRVKNTVSDWTIALYNQDVRDKQGFKKTANFRLMTGFEVKPKDMTAYYVDQVTVLQNKVEYLKKELARYTAQCPVDAVVTQEKDFESQLSKDHENQSIGVRDKKIILGTTGDFKKGLSGYAYAMNAGSQMVFDAINANGGFRDKQIELVMFDDSYDPRKAHSNVIKFLNEIGTDLIFNPLGSPTLLGYLDLVKSGKILVLFPDAGVPSLYDKHISHLINLQVPYDKEGRFLAYYAVKTLSSKRFALLYQNDAYGIPPKDAAREELKKLGILDENIIDIPYDRNNINVSVQANQLKKFNPQALLLFCTSAWAKDLIRLLGVGFFSDKQLFALSLLSTKEFRDFMHRKGLSFVFTAQTPNPDYSMIELVKEFRDNAKKYKREIDVSTLQGYIAAELFVYLLNRIPNNHAITKETLINAAQSIKHQNYKGLSLHYDENTHAINSTFWLCTQENSDWLPIDNVN